MELHNTKTNFGAVSRSIHLIYALLFFVIIGLALFEQNIAEGSPYFVNLHSALGLITIALLVVRLIWLKVSGKPAALGTQSQKLGAIASFWMLVATMIMMPISGLLLVMAKARDLDFFGLFTVSGFVERSPELINTMSFIHEYLSYFAYALIAGHVIGTVYHHFVVKDATITRMFGKPE